METTATANVYEQLADEFPEGCTGEQANEFMVRAGHTFGSPQAALKEMGSALCGGPGGGIVKGSATRGQKMRSGKLRKGINK